MTYERWIRRYLAIQDEARRMAKAIAYLYKFKKEPHALKTEHQA